MGARRRGRGHASPTSRCDYPRLRRGGRAARRRARRRGARRVRVRLGHRHLHRRQQGAGRARRARERADGGEAVAAAQRRQRHLLRRAAHRCRPSPKSRCACGSTPSSRAAGTRRGWPSLATSIKSADEAYMRQAVRLALRARGRTSPNPLVGCVIVRDGRVLATRLAPEGRRRSRRGSGAAQARLARAAGDGVRDARAARIFRAHAAVHRSR